MVSCQNKNKVQLEVKFLSKNNHHYRLTHYRKIALKIDWRKEAQKDEEQILATTRVSK
jgi:hypothetical protein